MSANTSNFNRESFCVTCLSQDRKLFSVSASEMCAKFYFELSLLWTDKICWECYYTVKKMVAFKSRAQAAQAWLRNATINYHEPQCLSTLSISSGIRLNILGPDSTTESITTNPLAIVIKEEVDFDESMESSIIDTVCKKEADVSSDGEELKEESIKDLGEKRRIEEVIQTPSNTAKRKAKSPTPVKQPDVYTETKMTEEQMAAWWLKKRESKFFTQSIPSERCDTCIQPLDHVVDVKTHAVRHTQSYGELECDICHQRAQDEMVLKFHRQQHYRLLQCLHCEFSWDNVNTMRLHGKDVHQIKQSLWECDECGRQFTSNKNFWKHIRHHRLIKCPETVKKRRLIAESEPKVQCKDCGKYISRKNIKKHIKIHNTEVDPAAYCKECGIQFKTALLYKGHMTRKMHKEESFFRFQCDKCSKKFTRKVELRLHLVVHEENRTVYPCEQCGQSFVQQGSLLRHKQKKHEGMELPRDKLCDYCGKGFCNKQLLADHLNTHTGIRPHVCKLCGADFGYKSALYLHGRYKHKIQKKNTNKTTKANKSSKTIEGTNSKKKRRL